MLHTIVPMDQIFPSGNPDWLSGSPDWLSGFPDERNGKTEEDGGLGRLGVFCGVVLAAEAAQGGAMTRLDSRTAAKAFPC